MTMPNAWRDWLFWTAVTLVCVFAFALRGNGLSRVEGLVLADEAEYLLMAESLRSAGNPPVMPKRPWGLPLLQAPLLEMDDEDPYSGFDASPARAVSVAALLLAAAAAALFAKRAAGRWAALVAFGLVVFSPEVGYWSQTFLTDVPFAALAMLGVALWARGSPFAAGMAMGSGLLFRYPGFLFLGAFVVVMLLQRRWPETLRFALGCLPPLLALGLLDAIFWSQPFESVLVFTSDQAAAFLPDWIYGSSDAVKGAVDPDRVLAAPRNWYKRPLWFYARELPNAATWPALALLALYPLARFGLERRREVDVLLFTGLVYLVGMSGLQSKEVRYLVPILPLFACVGAATCAGLCVRTRELIAGRGGAAAGLMIAGLLAIVLGFSGRESWRLQRARPHQPNGAIVEALPPLSAGHRLIGVDAPWKLASDVQVRGTWSAAWIGPRRGLVHAPDLFLDLASSPGSGRVKSARTALDSVDWWMLPRTWRYQDSSGLWVWINASCTFEGLVYDPVENIYPVMSFRPGREPGAPPCLWETFPPADGEALARFAGGLELRSATLVRPDPRSMQARVDFIWSVPADFPGGAFVTAYIERVHDDPSIPPSRRAADAFEVVPEEGDARAKRVGVLLRESRYFLLAKEPLRVTVDMAVNSWDEPLAVEETTLQQFGPTGVIVPLGDG